MAKAQIFSLDAVIASAIFIFIMLAAAELWQYSREKTFIEETRNDMEVLARNALSMLVETGGKPENWTAYEFNESNIQSLGLADEYLQLNSTKISSLSGADYPAAKTMLGIQGPNYGFEIEIGKWNGSEYSANSTIGQSASDVISEVVKVERYVLLDDSWAKATMSLWKSCEEITC